jgi:hypothetical protein
VRSAIVVLLLVVLSFVWWQIRRRRVPQRMFVSSSCLRWVREQAGKL